MSGEECPRLDCIFNLTGACHHALHPDPEGCKYYQPPKETRETSHADHRFISTGFDGLPIDAPDSITHTDTLGAPLPS
jgi:hypothetical protein